MKSDTSIRVIFLDVYRVGRQSAVLTALAGTLFISLPVRAENTVRFHGSVVNATCNLQQGNPVEPALPAHQIEPVPGMKFQIAVSRDACGGAITPFVARYVPLRVSSTAGASASGPAGIVTLTYQ